MARRKYSIRPLGIAGVSAQLPELHHPYQYGVFKYGDQYSTINFKTTKMSAKKRWGYIYSRLSTGTVLNVVRYKAKDEANDAILWLNLTDLCKYESAVNGTYSYLTSTSTYTGDSQVDSIDAATQKIVTFEGAANLSGDGIAAGDYFVLDEDLDSDSEPDTSWRVIESVDSDTQLTLSTAYEKAVTSPGAKNARIRKIYTGPSNMATAQYGLWNWAVVDDKLIFCNENDDVQYYNYDNTYADALDATNAKNFKYCIDYADRLILANTQESTLEDSMLVQWSKNGDPTDWTDSTAGSATLQSSQTEITGLGKIGSYLLVFTPKSIIFGYRTGVSTSPIAFQDEKVGIGAFSPYGIVHAAGTVFFLGHNNFYKLSGTDAVPIGMAIHDEFFENVASSTLKKYIGLHSPETNEIWWVESLSKWVYAYDYVNNLWNHYYFLNDTGSYLSGGGVSRLSSADTSDTLWFGGTTSVGASGQLYQYRRDLKGDNTQVMTCVFRTKRIDFSDQDKEALGRWKTVYRIRLIYVDNVTATIYNIYYRTDSTSSWTPIGGESCGNGSKLIKTNDFDIIIAGDQFEFYVTESSSDKTSQIIGLDIFYELGGAYFTV